MEKKYAFYDSRNSGIAKTKRWDKIDVGSIIRIMTEEEVLDRFGSLEGIRGFDIWSFQKDAVKRDFLGKTFRVNSALLKRIQESTYETTPIYQPTINRRKAYFPLGMFIIEDEGVNNFEEESDMVIVKYPFKIDKDSKKSEIIEEMISKVDKENLRSMMSLGYRTKLISDEVLNIYLQQWAYAKYEFYLMLGRNLSVSKEIVVSAPTNELEGKIISLKSKYSCYSIILNLFNINDYIDNVCPDSEVLTKYNDIYTRGMKLSKFFSKYFKDTQFDIDYSKVLQYKNLKTKAYISIDPCDYMTQSINKNNWKSCHNQHSGMYGTAPYSLMLDECTLVAYTSDGKKVHYEFNALEYDNGGIRFEFDWNSKNTRTLVNIDLNSGAMCFNKPYPNASETLNEEIRQFAEENLANYLGIKNEWKICPSYPFVPNVAQIGDFHYKDPVTYTVIHETMDERQLSVTSFNIGVDRIPCLCCGKPLSGGYHIRSHNMKHRDCANEI